ncbi:TraR/DksA C4-type zinc finger protein [Paenibacillus albidus]|uniref:TraR/DksA C4-type zinc finger protein n=1 Tax=Paenibacillus albidus TaxID=2041023 RepID=UPI0020364641|nr:TraR/DksA C4-type zinc finger protein [Paenibacillus albidus]
MSTGELSSVDNHPGDIGTETFERSRDLAINDKLAQELEEIEAALQRMDEGTYGICIASKEEIPYERLEAIPYTAYTA